MVDRSGDREEWWLVLPHVRLADEGVPVLGPPLAAGLAAADLIVKMRPAAAPPFLAEKAELLSHRDLLARMDVDRLQVDVAVIPASIVEDEHLVLLVALPFLARDRSGL